MTARELIRELFDCMNLDCDIELEVRSNENSAYSIADDIRVIDCGKKIVIEEC